MQGVRTPTGIIWNGSTVPALCLDLDGTIRRSKSGKTFIDGPEDVELFPDVEAKLWEYRDKGYLILAISNQAGVAFGYKSWEQVMAELYATFAAFERNPIQIAKQCFHSGDEGTKFPFNKRSLLRKPDIGMLALMECDAFEEGYLIDWDNSLFVGDRVEDAECAVNARIPFEWANTFFGRVE